MRNLTGVGSREEDGRHDAVIDGAFAQTRETDVSSGPGGGKVRRCEGYGCTKCITFLNGKSFGLIAPQTTVYL